MHGANRQAPNAERSTKMCSSITRLILAVGLATLGTTVSAQYAPTPDPGERALRQQQAPPPPAPKPEAPKPEAPKPEAPKPDPFFDGSWGGWRAWLGGIALLIAAGIGVVVWRRRRNNRPAHDDHGNDPQPPANPNPNPNAPPPPTPVNHMIALMLVGGALALATLGAPSVSAAPMEGCVVTAVNGMVGDAEMPVLVSGADNFVSCHAPGVSEVKLTDGKGQVVPVKKLVKTSDGFNFSYTPPAGTAAELHVQAGSRKVASLYTNSAFGAWTAYTAVQSVRPEIRAAATDASAALTAAKSAAEAVTKLTGVVADHGTRITALESRPAPTVDLSAYDRRLRELDGELAKVKAAQVATDAQVAKNAEGLEALGNRRVGKGGIFGRSGRLADLPEAK